MPLNGITTGVIGPLVVSVMVTVPLRAADALVVALLPADGIFRSVTSPFSASMMLSMCPPGWAVMVVVSSDAVVSLAPLEHSDVKLAGKNSS